MSVVLQDKAEELLQKLYREGDASVEAETTGASASEVVKITPPSVASVSVLTLGGATPVLTLPAPSSAGERKRVYLVQDGVGHRVPSWASASGSIAWATGVAPVLQVGAGEVNRVDFESYDGVNWYGTTADVEALAAGEFTNVTATGNATVTGTLGVTGTTTLGDAKITTAEVSGNATVGGTFKVTGVTTLGDAKITTAEVSGAATVGSTLKVTGATTLSGGASVPTGEAVTLEGTTTLTVGTGATKLGGSLAVTGEFGCNGLALKGKAGAYTLTYNTEARTVPAATVAAVATTGAELAKYGFTEAQANAIPVAINALAADVLALKKVIVALVKDSQGFGFAA